MQLTEEQQRIRETWLSKKKILKGMNCIQTLLFTWITAVLSYGNKVILDQQTIPQMPEGQHAYDDYVFMKQQIQTQNAGSPGMRVLKSLARCYRKSISLILLTATLSTVISMTLPTLTGMVINYVQRGEKELKTGLTFIALILALKFIQNLAETHLFFHFTILGYNSCNSLSLCIYNKASRFPTLCSKEYTVSELINYSQVDAQRLTSLGFYTAAVIFFPIQLGVGVFLMYRFIGISFLAGIGVIIIMGIFIFINSKFNARANEKLQKARDKRMKTTNEMFNLIRFIKVNAWQKYFFKKLNRARMEEMSHIRRTSLYGVISILFYWVTTPLILSTTFAVFVLKGQVMTAQKAFTTIILFNILQFPLRSLPESVIQLTQVWVSMKRIGKFLYAEEMNKDYIASSTGSDNAIQIRDGTFYWDLQQKKEDKEEKSKENKKQKKKSNVINTDPEGMNQSFKQPSEAGTDSDLRQSLLSQAEQNVKKIETPHIKALKRINLNIRRGKFTVILGDIGSGKSSLLYSILGEMKPCPGYTPRVNISGSVSLVVQKAWIMSCSIQQNITMASQRDERKLQDCLKYSCLNDDLSILPDGLKTMIGQKGINVSGGQKARISLARALYSDKDIYLLDDIISAVDVHVGNFIVKQTLLDYLEGKTRVLVTHAITYAKYADCVIVMKKGEIVEQGTYEAVRESRYFKQIQQFSLKEDQKKTEKQPKLEKQPSIAKQESVQTKQHLKVVDKLVEQLMLPEDKQKGQVNWATYKLYFNLNGGFLFIALVLFFMACWLGFSTLANIQVQRWCQDPKEGYVDLWWFTGLSVISGFFAFFRALTLVFAGIKQGTIAHKKMTKGLLYASIPQFFDRVPIGRILNRVSKDLRELDQNIGFTFGSTLVSIFSLLSNLLICVYASTVYIIIPIIFFCVICYLVKNYYIKTQRQVVRLENISSSPIVSGFNEMMNGLPTIRAYELEEMFTQRQCKIVNINKRNRITKEALESWFSQRLAWLSYLINISAIAYAILGASSNASMAGLLLAYSFSIDQNVISVVFSLAALQTRMISVQRVSNFMNIEPQSGYIDYTKKWNTKDEPAVMQFQKGQVQFDHLTLKYRPNLPSVLKSLTFNVKAGEKIGIVGRTGAGKSTITSSILRIVEPTEGAILIDGKNTMDMPLKDLRSSITLISQQPVMIEGTLRENLDPRKQYTDTMLLQTLKKCCLQDVFKERQGLDTLISDSGDNLSIGEKQLVCIARAILRNSKLVLIDEATANIDVKADNLIQQTIRQCFKEATVITIAHRIKTIMNSDKIIVMAQGRVAEMGSPQKLIENQGLFYQLHEQSKTESAL